MRAQIALLVAGVVASAPTSARADDFDVVPCCRAGDDRPHCEIDSTDVLGYRRCPRYGSWGANLLEPYVYVELGMNIRHLAPDRSATTARTTSPGPTPTGGGSEDKAVTFVERIGFGLGRPFYGAVDFEFGNFGDFNAKPTDHDLLLAGLASFGARGPVGPFAISAEVTGGVLESSSPIEEDVRVHGVLEARARAGLWLGPWCTIGGILGESLLDRKSWMFGVYLGVHNWSFAGDR